MEETGALYSSVLHSVGAKPLQDWQVRVRGGAVLTRVADSDVKAPALELKCDDPHNATATYITCPRDPAHSIGTKLQCIVLIVKNLGIPFFFEVQVVDDKGVRRRFRASTAQNSARVKPFVTAMPLNLTPGWNRLRLDLASLTKKAYGTTFVEVVRVQVHASCRVRHIYFCGSDFDEKQLAPELRAVRKKSKRKKKSKTKASENRS